MYRTTHRPRRALSLLLLSAIPAMSAHATKQNTVFLGDRISQFDAAIVAGPGSVSVIQISNPPDGRPYVAVAHVTVQEVIKGTGLTVNGDVDIALERPSADESVAQMAAATSINDSAVWLLERLDPSGPAPFLARAITEPDSPVNASPYFDIFRGAASAETSRATVHMALQLPLSSAPYGQPFAATVQVYTNPGESGALPAPIPWEGHVEVSIEPTNDPASPPNVEIDGVPSAFAVLSAIGQGGDTIPANLGPGSQFQADLTLYPNDMNLPGPQEFRCYARLIDDNGFTLLQAPPAILIVTP